MQQIQHNGKFRPRIIALSEYMPNKFMAEVDGNRAAILTPNDKRNISKILDNKSYFLSTLARIQEQDKADKWQQEAELLAVEQMQDLANHELSWWEPAQLSESDFFEIMAEAQL